MRDWKKLKTLLTNNDLDIKAKLEIFLAIWELNITDLRYMCLNRMREVCIVVEAPQAMIQHEAVNAAEENCWCA